MVPLNPVDRSRLEAFIADRQTVLDFELLFEAVMELQIYMAQPGDIVYSAGTTRARALPANGASLLRASYPALFAAIGTTYGAADATHFNVPNLAGRVVAGKEAAANLLTVAGSGINGSVLGATGGSQSHLLTAAEMPAHHHGVNNSDAPGAHTHAALNAGHVAGPTGTHTTIVESLAATTDTGGGLAHRNVQPTIILNAFILY
jgi:microcystin-dependent protein